MDKMIITGIVDGAIVEKEIDEVIPASVEATPEERISQLEAELRELKKLLSGGNV